MRRETKEEFVRAIEMTQSMRAAARHLGMSYDVFKRLAHSYGLFNPNPAGKGRTKPKVFKTREDVFKIFNYDIGRHIVKEWYLLENEYKCSNCSISEWNKAHLVLELEHINGDRRDNRIENLTILCPNCHSQTRTFRKRKNTSVV